jgi:hypothetical protein
MTISYRVYTSLLFRGIVAAKGASLSDADDHCSIISSVNYILRTSHNQTLLQCTHCMHINS